jgi:HEPN domain-containing protein
MKRHEQVWLYLRKATEDEALVDEVIDSPRVSDAAIGFHCQQAAEKLLKAFLTHQGIRFRRTHDLKELMDLMVDNGIEIPGPLMDRQEARKMIRGLRAWVEDELR